MSGRGGAREGAGRKAKADKYSPKVVPIEDRLADRLPATIGNLEAIADGTAQRVEEIWEVAGKVVVEVAQLDAEGNPVKDSKDKPITYKRLVYPDLPADQLVLVEKKIVTPGPDRQANEYLADRIMGKPVQAVEMTGEDGGPIEVTADVRLAAARELEEWRQQMIRALPGPTPPTPPSNTPSASPTAPIS